MPCHGGAGQQVHDGIGGHISTYASPRPCTKSASIISSAPRPKTGDRDFVYFQGHASPGIYARAFLEGRLRSSSWRTSATNSNPAAVFRPIRIRG